MNTTDDAALPDCDAFKKLDAIYAVDPRYAARGMLDPKAPGRPTTIEDHWRDIETLTLHEGVPIGFHAHMETAKNALLYSWFAYRLHAVAEMHARARLTRHP